MDREQALKIADRIMDRVEQDRALHRDAIADEVIAGFALAEAPTWIGVDWASDNTSDMSVMGIITRAYYDRIDGIVPVSPPPYGKSPAMAASEAWADLAKSLFPPPPVETKEEIAARLNGVPKPHEVPAGIISAKYATWREWSSADLIAAGWYLGVDGTWRPLP